MCSPAKAGVQTDANDWALTFAGEQGLKNFCRFSQRTQREGSPKGGPFSFVSRHSIVPAYAD
jgi:hypothetical protein